LDFGLGALLVAYGSGVTARHELFNVTWVDGEFWHGIWQGDESDMRRVDPRTGEV
jgi:glutamine cyclotransferase